MGINYSFYYLNLDFRAHYGLFYCCLWGTAYVVTYDDRFEARVNLNYYINVISIPCICGTA